MFVQIKSNVTGYLTCLVFIVSIQDIYLCKTASKHTRRSSAAFSRISHRNVLNISLCLPYAHHQRRLSWPSTLYVLMQHVVSHSFSLYSLLPWMVTSFTTIFLSHLCLEYFSCPYDLFPPLVTCSMAFKFSLHFHEVFHIVLLVMAIWRTSSIPIRAKSSEIAQKIWAFPAPPPLNL